MRDVIEQRHVRGPTGKCVYDGDYWPCDARTLLDRSDPAVGLREAVQKASDDLLNDEMSDLESGHLNARFRHFAKQVRAALAATPTASPTATGERE